MNSASFTRALCVRRAFAAAALPLRGRARTQPNKAKAVSGNNNEKIGASNAQMHSHFVANPLQFAHIVCVCLCGTLCGL